MNLPSWNDLENISDSQEHATPNTDRTFLAVMILALIALVLLGTGCASSMESFSETIDSGRDLGRVIEGAIDQGEDITEEAGEFGRELKETGQTFRGLRNKTFNVQLFVPSEFTGVNVVAKPVGSSIPPRQITPGESRVFGLDSGRFPESSVFTIYTEVNGRGHMVKVRQEFWEEIKSGPAEGLMLIQTRSGFVWIPPSVVDSDETIRYNDR